MKSWTSNEGPALGSLGQELFLAYTGPVNSQTLHVVTYTAQANGTFAQTGAQTLSDTAISNPAIAGFTGHVYLAFTGTNSDHNINVVQIQ